MALAVRVPDAANVKRVKVILEAHDWLDKTVKIAKLDDGSFVLPTTQLDASQLNELIPPDIGATVATVEGKRPARDSHEVIVEEALSHCHLDESVLPALLKALKRWSIYPPMVLFTAGSNLKDLNLPPQFYARLIDSGLFGRRDVSRIAENVALHESDRVRKPLGLCCLYGDFGPEPNEQRTSCPSDADFEAAFWSTCVQHGIYQTWAPRYTMFSRGNITEKARVLVKFNAQSPIAGTTVVDMYAGIGYFTLCYARSLPRRILCWEINPWSVEGLVRGAKANHLPVKLIRDNEVYEPSDSDLIVVFLEDNKRAPDRIRAAGISDISHINMGLLPDCRPAWQDAHALAQSSTRSCILHVHENVHETNLERWPTEVTSALPDSSLEHLESIKMFAPSVHHVCGDFRVSPLCIN